MKKITLIILVFTAFQAKSQIFSEDFNSGIPSTFTLLDLDQLTPNNTNYTVGSFAGTNLTSSAGVAEDCAVSISWFNPIACCADDWMITPSITIPSSTNPIMLTFNAIAYESAYPDGVEVYVSTTGANPSDFLSTTPIYNTTPTTPGPVSTPIPGNGENDTWTIRSVDISNYSGQTIYIAFRNNSNDMNILGIDDIIVKELQDNNAELTSLDITPYSVAPANINISGVVTNTAGNTITSLEISWSDGINSYTDNLNVNIISGATYNFTHTDQLSMLTAASANISVTIDMVNGNVDPDMSNNTLSANATTLTSIPEKFTVGEEKTGSWCGWCPRGAVALAQMETTPNFIGIAVHNADPMTISSYDGGIGTYIAGGYPGGGVDRVLEGDPSDFSMLHNQRVNDIVPCGVNSINASFDNATNKISVSTEIEAFGEMSGNFRLSCVIVEDDLVSTGSGWAQTNYYSGGGSGVMAFPANINGGYNFSTGNDPAQPSDFGGYDHVARSLSSNNILGDPNSLPAGLLNVGTYNYTFSDVSKNSLIAYNAVGFDWTKAYAVVMIINSSTGEILNAKKAALSINNPASSWDCDPVNGCADPGTGNGQYNSLSACNIACITSISENIANLSIYPNPIKNTLSVKGAFASLEIFDMFGKLILTSNYASSINVSELANGIYILNIHTDKGTKTQKIAISK
jgi:hypothetical protein